MLTKLRIVNFKCLQDTGELDIRPLTFLVGPNSSGKSSVLQMLLMLRQTVDSMDTENPLTPNDGWVSLGAYPDFIFGQDPKRQLEVHLSFRAPSMPFVLGRQSLNAVFRFRYNRKTTQVRLETSEWESDDPKISARIFWVPTSRRHRVEVVENEEGESRTWKAVVVRLSKFYNMLAAFQGQARPDPSFNLYMMGEGIEGQLKSMKYLGPSRQLPQRSYIISGQAPMDVGVRGERTAEVLWYATRTRERRREMLQQINLWLQDFGVALEARLERLGQSNQYQVLFADPASKLAVNLADVGFGASQVLPVIVQGYYAQPGSLLLVEQPEIHLHPKAQATLGDLLVAIAKQGDRRLIVETHSEHVLGRVQRCIAEEKISRDQVAIYYFNPSPEGTQIQEVTIDELGQFENFPEGFFEEGFQEAVAHSKAIRERIGKGT